ncbi:hypothetical protein ACHAXT_007890 [Thalassiosira profunda]
MKEAVAELRGALGRLRPRLLRIDVAPAGPSSDTGAHSSHNTEAADNNATTSSQNNGAEGSAEEIAAAVENGGGARAIAGELQLEAVAELAAALASFVWSLDCHWDACLAANGGEGPELVGAPVGGGEGHMNIPSNSDGAKGGSGRANHVVREPPTEWNDEAKSLIREGYGLLANASRSHSDDGSNSYYNSQAEALRTVVRSSMLEVLPSLSTSACRHFLLAFLPHFMPLALVGRKGGGDVPTWLFDGSEDIDLPRQREVAEAEAMQRSGDGGSQSTELLDGVAVQALEVFQSLIQADVSTLVPFLSTLTTLFEHLPKDREGDGSAQPMETSKPQEDDVSSSGDIAMTVSDDVEATTGNARAKCFRLCLASLPSVSEHDLPSLLHSLFASVRNEAEGRLAMAAVRDEWTSICGGTALSENAGGNDLVFFIGNVILQSMLSGQVAGANHLAEGFVGALRSALDASNSSTPLTLLDAIVSIALYARPEYEGRVQSILDCITAEQTLSFLELTMPLVQSWRPSTTSRWSDRERANSLLYEPLASPLASMMFYVMISSSSSVETALMGGLLSFHNDSKQYAGAAMDDDDSFQVTDACCRMISELFSAVDPQRRDQIANSLLSMVSDSFVRSAPSEVATNQSGRRRRRRTTNASDAKERRDDQATLLGAARAACRALLLVTQSHASELSQIRGSVLDRLLLLASMTTNSSESDPNETDGEIAHHLFDMNCAIVTSLLHDDHRAEAGAGSSGSAELLILCQKLLFSSNALSTATSISNGSYQHRVVCGLILAARLLRCKLVPTGERVTVLGWARTVISPSSTADTPLQSLDPEIARWGLRFLQVASSGLPCGSTCPEMAPVVETQSVCGQSDCFDQVNKMLATVAIIQMEDSLKVSLHQSGTPIDSSAATPRTFLAFAEASAHNYLHKKSASTTSMVVCAPYYLGGSKGREGQLAVGEQKRAFLTPINVVATYVYDLLDRYLELGMAKTDNWNPRGWLLAKIQLPCCLTAAAMELLGMSEYGLELDADLHENASDSRQPTSGDDFHKRWKLLFADDTRAKAEIVLGLVEFAQCLVVSISVSSAVLKHAYNRFEREEAQLSAMGTDSPLPSPAKVSGDTAKLHRRKKKQLEALRKLLQFQVNKIHSMQRICNNICIALNGLCAEVYKLNAARKRRAGGNAPKRQGADGARENVERPHQRKQIPLYEVKATVTAIEVFLSSPANHIHSSILWSCLDDDADDVTLLKTMNPALAKSAEEEGTFVSSAMRIIRLRRTILRYLQLNSIQTNDCDGSLPSMRSEEKLRASRGISRAFRMTISLTDCLDSMGKQDDGSFSSTITALLTAHYKLLLAAFSSATRRVPLRSSLKDNLVPSSITSTRRKQSSPPEDRSTNHLWLDDVIQRCADSLPTVNSGPRPTPIDALSDSIRRQLERSEDASISCQLVDLLSILLMHTNHCRNNFLAELTSGALHSVYTSSVGRASLPYSVFRINDVLANVASDEDYTRTTIASESFNSLVRTANALLKARDAFTAAAVHHLLAHWGALILEGASQFQCINEAVESMDAFLARDFRRSKQNGSSPRKRRNASPGLNDKTYSSLFELLLHMIGASFVLARPRRSKKKRSGGPYGEVIWPLKAYGKLLSVFQANHVHFARRFVLIVVKSSLAMLRLCDFQLQQCVDWRNSQQPQIGAGNDSAAAELLQPLVDAVASHCIGAITSFCNAIKVQQKGNASWGTSYKHSKAVAGLLYRCEGTKETLQSICTQQQISSPSRKRKEDEGSAVERKRKRSNREREATPQRRVRSRHASDKTHQSPSVLELLGGPRSGNGQHLRFDAMDDDRSQQSQHHSTESSDSGEDESLQGSADGDDSFGVVGDWAA